METQPTIDQQQMLPQGTMLRGSYRIDRYLASGGFGNTYVATNTAFDETVVIKEFFIRGTSERGSDLCTVSVSQSNQKLFSQQLQKFKKEAQRVRKLHNSHIVQVHDLFVENGTAYYVMDYIDGQSLSEKMKQQGHPFGEAEVEGFIRNVADALKTVHAVPIQHLDIKPGNIMLDKQGHVYLIDFGACKQITADGTMTTTTTSMCYTPGYAPVEQIDQRLENIGAWTDIYALGATAYNLLTQQKPPLPSDVVMEGDDAFHFPASISDRMKSLILSCMVPNFKKRPQNIDAMLALLGEDVGVSPVIDSEETLVGEKKESVSKKAPVPTDTNETVVTTPLPLKTPVQIPNQAPANIPAQAPVQVPASGSTNNLQLIPAFKKIPNWVFVISLLLIGGAGLLLIDFSVDQKLEVELLLPGLSFLLLCVSWYNNSHFSNLVTKHIIWKLTICSIVGTIILFCLNLYFVLRFSYDFFGF